MTRNPRDPKLSQWLISLDPRQELVMRSAMRVKFADVCADRAFSDRVASLWECVNPHADDTIVAEVLGDATKILKSVEELVEPEKRKRP
jgi:hypothetical protein